MQALNAANVGFDLGFDGEDVARQARGPERALHRGLTLDANKPNQPQRRNELFNSSHVSADSLVDIATRLSPHRDLCMVSRPIRTFEDIARACNWVVNKETRCLTIKARTSGIAIARVADDYFGSGTALAAIAAAAAIKENVGCNFVTDVDFSERKRLINQADPYARGDLECGSYGHYLSKVHSDSGGAFCTGYDTSIYRNGLTGVLNVAALSNAIEQNDDDSGVVLFGVELGDLQHLRGFPHVTYFQTQRDYQADAMMNSFSHVKLALRKPHGTIDNFNRWLVIDDGDLISTDFFPLCPGPEHNNYVYELVEIFSNAADKGVFAFPEQVQGYRTPYQLEVERRAAHDEPHLVLPGKKNGWLDILPSEARPTLLHYESIDSVYWNQGNERTLELYEEWPGRYLVFGEANKKGKIHQGYLQMIKTLKCMTLDDVDLFHAAIAAFSGVIPNDFPWVPQPVWAAVYLMSLETNHGFSTREFNLEEIKRSL